MYQDKWKLKHNIPKVVLRGKFIGINTYIKKLENSPINFTPQETTKNINSKFAEGRK